MVKYRVTLGLPGRTVHYLFDTLKKARAFLAESETLYAPKLLESAISRVKDGFDVKKYERTES